MANINFKRLFVFFVLFLVLFLFFNFDVFAKNNNFDKNGKNNVNTVNSNVNVVSNVVKKNFDKNNDFVDKSFNNDNFNSNFKNDFVVKNNKSSFKNNDNNFKVKFYSKKFNFSFKEKNNIKSVILNKDKSFFKNNIVLYKNLTLKHTNNTKERMFYFLKYNINKNEFLLKELYDFKNYSFDEYFYNFDYAISNVSYNIFVFNKFLEELNNTDNVSVLKYDLKSFFEFYNEEYYKSYFYFLILKYDSIIKDFELFFYNNYDESFEDKDFFISKAKIYLELSKKHFEEGNFFEVKNDLLKVKEYLKKFSD